MKVKTMIMAALALLLATGEFSIYGHEVRSGKAKVERWLKGIGF